LKIEIFSKENRDEVCDFGGGAMRGHADAWYQHALVKITVRRHKEAYDALKIAQSFDRSYDKVKRLLATYDDYIDILENEEYYNDDMGETLEFCLLAHQEGVAPQRLRELLDQEKRAGAEISARETTYRELAVMPDKTLERRRKRYAKLLEKIELPPAGFTTREQYKLAANLSQTYRLLREREAEGQVEPTPKDPRVVEAERLKTRYQRHGQRFAGQRALVSG
jgi:hypothetical protein